MPYRTHSIFLPFLISDMSIAVQLYIRILKFFHNNLQSSNLLLTTCTKLALHGSNSACSNTLKFILRQYNLNNSSIYNHDFSYIRNAVFRKERSILDETVKAKCDFILDILSTIHGKDFTVLCREELITLLNFLCTD